MRFRSSWREDLGRILRNAAGWIVLACLVFAPLAYGTTSWSTERILAGALLAAFGLWIISSLLRRARPHPGWFEVSLAYLLVAGWWMAFNAHRIYDPAYRSFIILQDFAPTAPGSLDQLASWTGMIRITGLLAALVIVRSLATEHVWHRRILKTMALTGSLVAVVGLALKVGGPALAPWVWEPSKRWETNFAFFHYHAHAGAFLNLALGAALASLGMARSAGAAGRVTRDWRWAGSVFVILVAIQINLSKAALAIGLAIVLLFAAQWIRRSPAVAKRKQLPALGIFIALTLLITAALGPFIPYPSAWQKWETLPQPQHEEKSIGYRLAVERLALRMDRDAGWWGFGPESFEAAFVAYQDAARYPPGRFDAAHEDYLQTVAEWGVGGALAWSFLVFGGVWRAIRCFLAHRSGPPSPASWEWCAVSLACLGVLVHAGFDYPLQIDSIRLYLLMLLGLAWAESSSEHAASDGGSER